MNKVVILWKRTEGARCSDKAGEVQPNKIKLSGFLYMAMYSATDFKSTKPDKAGEVQ